MITHPADCLLGYYAEGAPCARRGDTPPYKSIIYNDLYALSLARGGAMRRGCWASHAEGALSGHGGHEYARISFYQHDDTERTEKNIHEH